MKERPILSSAPEVRALLAGTKTQMRRVVKPMRGEQSGWLTMQLLNLVRTVKVGLLSCGFGVSLDHPRGGPLGWIRCPYGQPGDRLWVRETWAEVGTLDPGFIVYKADYPASVPAHLENVPTVDGVRWKPSIHMFRTDSRITLEVTAVRVERLQDISEADAKAEGMMDLGYGEWSGGNEAGNSGRLQQWPSPVLAYHHLWESINGPGSWDANPWVWVVEFKRV